MDRHAVEVRRRVIEGAPLAGFGGLMTCGSVWACPRCSAVISANRSAEIGEAIRECNRRGGSVLMLTLTLRHRRGDELRDLFGFLTAGWRAAVGSRAWSGAAGDRDRFGVAGLVRVVEATVSRPGTGHGWHLHIHALAFLMGDPSEGLREDAAKVLAGMFGHQVDADRSWLGRVVLAARLFPRWVSGVTKAGGRVPLAAGCDLRPVGDAGAEFLGGYLQKSTFDVAARLGAEIAAGGETKIPTTGHHLTPFEVLRELARDGALFGLRTSRSWEIIREDGQVMMLDHETGEISPIRSPGLWTLWHEWELATRGRRQIAWSHRPRSASTVRERFWNHVLDARGRTAEDTDDDLAAVELDGFVLGEIGRSVWYRELVWRPSWLTELLEAAESGGPVAAKAWADDHGIAYESR